MVRKKLWMGNVGPFELPFVSFPRERTMVDQEDNSVDDVATALWQWSDVEEEDPMTPRCVWKVLNKDIVLAQCTRLMPKKTRKKRIV